MEKIRVAINGFGRIGRLSFRRMLEKENIEVVAINDLMVNATLAHLLKYDSVHGRFGDEISSNSESVTVNEKRIHDYIEPDLACERLILREIMQIVELGVTCNKEGTSDDPNLELWKFQEGKSLQSTIIKERVQPSGIFVAKDESDKIPKPGFAQSNLSESKILHRIVKRKYAEDLSGTGGLYTTGRYHHQGNQVLYTSETVSGAMLEALANTHRQLVDMALITLEVPWTASIKQVNFEQLPPDWWTFPAPDVLRDMGTDWLREGDFWLMRVPSVHARREFNVLLNPLHSEHQTLKILSIEPHPFDPRLKSIA